MTPRYRRLVSALAMAGAVAIWAAGLAQSHVGLGARAEQARYLRAETGRAADDLIAEKRQAEAYWRANPDVAGDAHYGRAGVLGVRGARDHFEKHGRREGRQWPGGG